MPAIARHAIHDHAHELGLLLRRREPTEAARQSHHARLHGRLVGVARKFEEAVARAVVVSDRAESRRHFRHETLHRTDSGSVRFEMVEEHAHLGHVALQYVVHAGELLGMGGLIVRKGAHVAAEGRVRIGVAQACDGDHRTRH